MFNKKLIYPAMLMSGMFIHTPAQAQGAETIAHIYTQCGIGGLVFGHESLGVLGKTLASVSNIFWDFGTTAASSHSLSPDTCLSQEVKTAYFIKETFSDLENNLATGKGEHLQALNTLMACEAASQNVRRDYAEYTTTRFYTSATQQQNAEKLFKIVNDNLRSAQCNS